ncbi:nucleoside triphosphate pyrophosphohydrolase [Hydrogenobaculum acidophilum]
MSCILEDLIKTFEKVRQNCPWDKAQTHESLIKYVIEEAYELVDAIESKDTSAIKEELADLLLQVVFHSQIAKENGEFDINEVFGLLIKKLIERHPHVFGNEEASSVLENWEHKKAEKREYFLDGIPKSMCALMRCQKIQDRMAKVGFDFENINQVKEKLNEELEELNEAIENGIFQEIEHEFGDILIAIVEYGRFLGIDAERALQKANDRMVKRFNFVEKSLKQNGKSLKEATLEEMDMHWKEAKKFDYE